MKLCLITETVAGLRPAALLTALVLVTACAVALVPVTVVLDKPEEVTDLLPADSTTPVGTSNDEAHKLRTEFPNP